jgi:hypothetical protein
MSFTYPPEKDFNTDLHVFIDEKEKATDNERAQGEVRGEEFHQINTRDERRVARGMAFVR